MTQKKEKEMVQIDKEELEKLQLKAKGYEVLSDLLYDCYVEWEDIPYMVMDCSKEIALSSEAQKVLGKLGWFDGDDIHDIDNYWKPNAR